MNIDTVRNKMSFGGQISPKEWELIHSHNTRMIKDLTDRVHTLEEAVDRLKDSGGSGKDAAKPTSGAKRSNKRTDSTSTSSS